MCRFWCNLLSYPWISVSLLLSLTPKSLPPSLSYPQIFSLSLSFLNLLSTVLSLATDSHASHLLSSLLFPLCLCWLFLDMEIHIPPLTNTTSPLASHKQEHKNPVAPHSIIHGESRGIHGHIGLATCTQKAHSTCAMDFLDHSVVDPIPGDNHEILLHFIRKTLIHHPSHQPHSKSITFLLLV